MIKQTILSSLKIAGTLPALTLLLWSLVQMAQGVGFDHERPKTYATLIHACNFFLGVCIDYWLGWLFLSALLGSIYTLLVETPREDAKRTFAVERQRRIGSGHPKKGRRSRHG
jgi:hypothetical protein